MQRWILASGAVILGMLAGCAGDPSGGSRAPEGATPTGLLLKSVSVAGVDYRHAVFIPRGYTPQQEWPCVVFLHGAGECGTDGAKQTAQGIGPAILWNQAAWPCIVLMPQKPEVGKQWENYDAAVMAMLEQVKREYRVDPARIALTGLSQGGHGSWTIGAAHPEVWSAVAPICGYVNRGGEPDQAGADRFAAALKGVPVWAFHGEADNVVPPAQTRLMVEAFKRQGVEIRSSFYPGVNHNSWDRAYREEKEAGGLAAWLLSQRKAPK